jgi:hypothetical protein
MTRLPFRPSNDETRVLVARLQSTNDMHPLNARYHRTFVRVHPRSNP